MGRDALGDLEHLVLLALVRLDGETYGVPILEEINARTGREVSRPSIYIALRRLEAKGLLKSRLGEATAERGGRAKRYFRLTKAGARQLQVSRAALVDHARLDTLQQSCGLVEAEECFRSAFWEDVRPVVRAWRKSKGLPEDPLKALAESGYMARITSERAAKNARTVTSYA